MTSALRLAALIALGIATLSATACQKTRSPTRLAFKQVPKSSGFDFRHELPGNRLDNLAKSAMGGVALLDYDSDGLLDIYCVSGGWCQRFANAQRPAAVAPNRLYRNLGEMKFEDVTEAAGVGDTGFGMGACIGDFDNDGHVDLFVSNYEGSVLYRNRGDGSFEDITAVAGIAPGMHAGAAFLDYDRDGLLDLFISQYVDLTATEQSVESMQEGSFPGPAAYQPQPGVLYRNEGGGRFRDVTEAAGVGAPGKGMGVLATDVDSDGWVDIVVANDAMENFVFRNQGDGTFEEVGAVTGVAFGVDGRGRSSMGMTVADMDGDGRLDYLIPDTGGGSLYVARQAYFTDRAKDWGLADRALGLVGWVDVAMDADNDGRMDIYKVHGPLRELLPQTSQLFHSRGGGRFDQARSGTVGKVDAPARGAVAGDLDNDGREDLVVIVLEGDAVMFANRTVGAGNWVRFKLVGTRSNRMALGARVELRTSAEGPPLRLIREVSGAAGYISAADTRAQFGIGDAKGVESVTVRWPSGRTQDFGAFEAGAEYVLTEE